MSLTGEEEAGRQTWVNVDFLKVATGYIIILGILLCLILVQCYYNVINAFQFTFLR